MVNTDPTTPKGFLSFMRGQSQAWSKEDVPANAYIEATIIDTNGTTARIKRSGFDQDQQPYPTLSPYHPRVGDQVLCAVTSNGLYILGALNRGDAADVTINQYAQLHNPTLTGAPESPTPLNWSDNSDRIATTAHVKEVLGHNPTLGDPSAPGATTINGNFTVNGTFVDLSGATGGVKLADGFGAISSQGVNTALANYVLTATANATYLTQTAAASTYVTQNFAISNYAPTFNNGLVYNLASASSLGSVINKLAIYNTSHTLIGYIPVYNTIT